MYDPNNIPEVKMSPMAVMINKSNVCSNTIIKERPLIQNPNLWHRICIHNCENVDRDTVLNAIINEVLPHDLIPVRYIVTGSTATFFVRHCKLAIEKLCRQNLVVYNSQISSRPVEITIILAFSNTDEFMLDIQGNINRVLAKRYHSATRTLNLDNFIKDPELTEYCTFAQPKIFYFVLSLAKQYVIQNLRLANNNISLLAPIEVLRTMKTLTSLDLRNNMIPRMSELNILIGMQITDLVLDGNPVCDNYDDYSYILAVKEVCPKIEKLDGLRLGPKGFLSFRRNFVCKVEGQDLVDQFLEHYFTLYDSPNRAQLEGLYLKTSLFSLTCFYLVGQSTTATANLTEYKSISRNLNRISDLSKSNEFLMRGHKNIIKVLCGLPPTEHDPYSFAVDLVYYTADKAIITVSGVFRESTKSLLESEKILGFTRTFILVSSDGKEFNIVNDQLYVSNATTAQQHRAFKVVRVPKPSNLTMEPAKTEKDKCAMEQALMQITNLNLNWSKKFLEERRYDFKKTLTLFIDLYKVNNIPDQAFASL